jgi:subtilisin family serine protease
VNVAVWDEGVDISIFKDQIAKDSSGRPAVIAYDIEARRTTGALLPLTPDQASHYPEAVKYVKGEADLSENLDTPEAAEVRRIVSALTPSEVGPFQDQLSLFRRYAHGTHVAGILMAGNPYARLVVGRSTGEYRMIARFRPSAEYFDRSARASQEYVDFFRAQGVRVVNMSWGGSARGVEARLEQCGIGKPGDDRRQIARQWFGIWKKSLEEAFRSAPEILFIASAGNSNSDSSFDEGAPGGLRIPNLLTVGAVDMSGETTFSSYGPTVAVHANGYEVESYIPGGTRLKMSGTSMAAPNVGNLAAKILAVSPKLTPPEAIALIRQTAEKSANGRLNLIHPKNALAAARNSH